MTERPIAAEERLVILDNMRVPLVAGSRVEVRNLATFPGKGVIGDTSRDPDNISSALILTSFTGGGQVEVANEGSDIGRYWWGDLYGRAPGTLTLNRETIRTMPPESPPGGSAGWALGDIDPFFYAAFGTGVYRWQEGNMAWERVGSGTLAGPPVGNAVAFAGIGVANVSLYVPLGSAGIGKFDGTTITNQAVVDGTTPFGVIGLVEWDNKLIALDVRGRLWQTQNGTTWEPKTGVSAHYRPRRLDVFFDQQGTPTIHLTTDRGIFAWDPLNDLLYPADATFPSHPQNGLAGAVWRDQLIVSSGLDAYTYTGSVFTPMGPVRDDGLPGQFRGRIVSMWGEHNGLYALVAGSNQVSDELTDEDAVLVDPMHDRDESQVPRVRTASCLLVYDGVGWHADWINTEPAQQPTNVMTSEAESGITGQDYRIWWGIGGALYSQLLPTDAHNPRQGRELGVDRFARTGYLITPWYDMNSIAFKKLLSHVEVNLEYGSETARVSVSYQTDYDTTWTRLGDATSRGATVMGFGLPLDPPPTVGGRNEGIAVMRIRFLLTFERGDDATDSPVLDAFIVKHNLVPLTVRSWRFSADVSGKDGEVFGLTAGEIMDRLDGLAGAQRLVTFVHGRLNRENQPGGHIYRVLVSSVTGSDNIDQSDTGFRAVSLVEIPESVPTLAGQLGDGTG